MKNNVMSLYYQNEKQQSFNILKDLSVEITPVHNPFHIPFEALFSMAARINKNRAFLFVSKLLGKHIPVNPYSSLLGGAVLSLLLAKELGEQDMDGLIEEAIQGLISVEEAEQAYKKIMNQRLSLPIPVNFIGFAETATALGHSVYNVFKDDDSTYFHTTREMITTMTSCINFEEEHSHAVSHRCYAIHEEVITGSNPIMLVDDEITTGKTVLNIISDIQSRYPRQQYWVASLLDWRSEQEEQRFAEVEKSLGVSIKVLSLMKGKIRVQGHSIPGLEEVKQPVRMEASLPQFIYLEHLFESIDAESVDSEGMTNTAPYLKGSGRFGIHTSDNSLIDEHISSAAQSLMRHRSGKNTLCLGTGEFMYLPMRISAEMGAGISYHSTTRSPIHSADAENYAVKEGISFLSPDDRNVMNYIYNISLGQYDDLFLFLERDIPRDRLRPMLDAFGTKGFKKINVVVCGPKVHL